MKDEIEISVIIPTYNSQNYIIGTLESILNQTFKNFEIVVVDDFSEDKTWDTIIKFAKSSSKIKLFRNETKGANHARIRGANESKGKYIIYCDSDDFFAKNILELMLHEVNNYNLDIVCCNIQKVDLNGNIIIERIYDFESKTYFINGIESIANALKSFPTNIVAKLIKKSVFNEVISIQSSFCQDWMISYQLLCKCKRIQNLNLPLYTYVYRPLSISQYSRSGLSDIDNVFRSSKKLIYIVNNQSQIKEKDNFISFLKVKFAINLFGRLCKMDYKLAMALKKKIIYDLNYIDIFRSFMFSYLKIKPNLFLLYLYINPATKIGCFIINKNK